MADDPLRVRVVSPEDEVYSGEATSVVAPAWDGQVGILRGHAPFITLLGHGELVIDAPGGGSVRYYVAGGVLKVESNQLTILTEYAGKEAPEVLPPEAVIHPGEATEHAVAGNPLV
ncbi:MAG: F0F1 ATP synthase subunit epsilon [Gemmatimonadota bacterium]